MVDVIADVYGDELLAGMLSANSAGVDLDEYCVLRAAGIVHDEALECLEKAVALYYYLGAREAGLEHRELLMAHSEGIDLETLVEGLGAGLELAELVAVARRGSWQEGYLEVRKAGVPVRQARTMARENDCGIAWYLALREVGVSHLMARWLIYKRVPVEAYCRERRQGSGHHRAVVRAQYGIGGRA